MQPPRTVRWRSGTALGVNRIDSHWQVPLADVYVDDELVRAAHDAIASGWWSMGPRVSQFEQAFADYHAGRLGTIPAKEKTS